MVHYKHFLHTHSHIALLGWVYNAALIVIYHLILDQKKSKRERFLFWGTQVTILGMLFSFPFQGYGLYSIAFSTLYILISYGVTFDLFGRARKSNLISDSYLRWGGIYLFLSGIGPFLLGYFMAKDMGDTIWYNLAIYWFLHFLFNGFFLFTVFAYLAKKIETKASDLKPLKQAFQLMNFSIIPLFALSTLWTEPHIALYFISGFAALLQIAALYKLYGYKNLIPKKTIRLIKFMFICIAIAYLLKLTFQLMGSFSWIQSFINSTQSFTVIGFIHLVMLGFFSLFFLVVFIREKLMNVGRIMQTGILIFILGIITSEFLLFGTGLTVYSSGFMIANYSTLLMLASGLMPLGILLILWGYLSHSTR